MRIAFSPFSTAMSSIERTFLGLPLGFPDTPLAKGFSPASCLALALFAAPLDSVSLMIVFYVLCLPAVV